MTVKKMRKKKVKTKERDSKRKEGKAAMHVLINPEIREWAKKDAKRCGYTLPQYIEKLISERREIAPPFEEVTLLAR